MLEQFVERVRDLDEELAFEQAIADAISSLGFERFAYASIKLSGEAPQAECIVNYPMEWVCHYTHHDFLTYDPVIAHAVSSSQPFRWGDLDKTCRMTRKQKRVMNESRDFGLRNGAGIPIHAPGDRFGVICVTSSGSEKEFNKVWAENALRIQMMSLYFHSAIEQNLLFCTSSRKVHLTQLEQDILLWAAWNKTIDEISDLVSASNDEVQHALREAAAKLGVSSQHHAVVKAITMKLISP